MLDSLSARMKTLGKVADGCEGPAVMATTLVPVIVSIGPSVGVACAIESAIVQK